MLTVAASLTMFAPVLAGANPVPAADVGNNQGLSEPRYLYNVSSVTGAVASSWSTLWFDAEHGELYAVVGDTIRVFSRSGMETFSFPISRKFGGALSVATLKSGDIVAVSAGRNPLVRYSFRGEPVGPIEITGAPAGALEGFRADAIASRNGKIYVADRMNLRVVVTDERGAFERSWDLAPMLNLDGRKRAENAMSGFSVDAAGDILFTVPTVFQAFILSPDGKLRAFGSRGSGTGKFNLVGPIAADEDGRVLVLDVLKATVLVFDRNLEFLVEFGGRGWDRAGFIGPTDMVVGSGKAFVSQSAQRGVSVYRYSDVVARPSRDVAVAATGSAGELSEVAVHPEPQQSQALQ